MRVRIASPRYVEWGREGTVYASQLGKWVVKLDDGAWMSEDLSSEELTLLDTPYVEDESVRAKQNVYYLSVWNKLWACTEGGLTSE
jgi:hypothetical protein